MLIEVLFFIVFCVLVALVSFFALGRKEYFHEDDNYTHTTHLLN